MQDVQTGTEQFGVEVEAWGGLVVVLVRGQRPREEQVMGGQWVWKSENKGEVGERLSVFIGEQRLGLKKRQLLGPHPMTVTEEGGQEAAKWEGQLRLLCWQKQSSFITLYACLG